MSAFGARAEGPSLSVAPHTFELTVKRGEVLQKEIKILNKSEMAIPVKAKILDFTADDETGQMIFDESSQEVSIASRFWVKIENPDFILDPGETERVFLSINIPETAEPGGHYATILFEPQLPSYYFEEGKSRAIPSLGVLFLWSVEVEGVGHSPDPMMVAEFSIPEKFHLKRVENFLASVTGLFNEVKAEEKNSLNVVETSRLPFTLRIKNIDIYHIKPEGKLSIFKANGDLALETKISKTTILPGKIRKFPVELKPELPQRIKKYLPASASDFISKNILWGKYKAVLSLSAENKKLEQSIEFWAFPWRFWLSTGLAIAVLTLFLVKWKNRIWLASKALLKRS